MKIIVVGGTGFAGAKIVESLRASGNDARPASPSVGANTVTGAGVASAFAGAAVVVDASNAPHSMDPAEFFETSTRNVIAAAGETGVRHVAVVSIVNVDRLGDTPYFRGKQIQERLVRESGLPFSIARSTQFVEFLDDIADGATANDVVRLPPILIQPIPVADAAAAIARVAVGPPLNGIVDVAGPTRYRLDRVIAERLAASNDPRRVIADRDARYFGAQVSEMSLVPAR